MIFLDDLEKVRLSDDITIPEDFDCGDSDLNDFILNCSKGHDRELLTVTYLIQYRQTIIGFYSLLNDRINSKSVKTEEWNLFRKKVKKGSYNSFPAMKIGRFAIDNRYRNNKIGTEIIRYLKMLFITENRTGCRFVTVDAYKESIEFYRKNDFDFLTIKDTDKDTRQMYFDLIKIKNAILNAEKANSAVSCDILQDKN